MLTIAGANDLRHNRRAFNRLRACASGHTTMVVYNLTCGNAHAFEGWFNSPDLFETQVEAAELSCPVCGSCDVTKQPSAPNIARHRESAESTPATREQVEALRALQAQFIDHVIKNTEDVGRSFPDEARRIHRQEAAERPIRGQATQSEAKALRDEGIDVAMLPALSVPRDQLH